MPLIKKEKDVGVIVEEENDMKDRKMKAMKMGRSMRKKKEKIMDINSTKKINLTL